MRRNDLDIAWSSTKGRSVIPLTDPSDIGSRQHIVAVLHDDGPVSLQHLPCVSGLRVESDLDCIVSYLHEEVNSNA